MSFRRQLKTALFAFSEDVNTSRNRINDAFVNESHLGSPLPDVWDASSVYFDGLLNDAVAMSLRLVLPSGHGLPIAKYFDLGALALDKPCAEISHFTVFPQYRRKILRYDWSGVRDRAVEGGCGYIIVESFTKLEGFYLRQGLERCGEPFHDPSIRAPGMDGLGNVVPMLMKLEHAVPPIIRPAVGRNYI